MTDFSELKKLAQEANDEFPAKEQIWSMVCTPTVGLDLIAEIERLQRFETAYREFSDKTDWVQETAHWSELGLHRADVLRKRCDDLTSHNQAQADEILRLRRVMSAVVSAVPNAGARKGNAPGHCHEIPGVWDRANGGKSGKECGWCKVWNAAVDLSKEQQP